MSDTRDLPHGWVRLADGEIWTRGLNDRPIAYRSGNEWMICGRHSVADLREILKAISDE